MNLKGRDLHLLSTLLFLFVFSAPASPAAAAVSVNRNAVAVAQWLESVEDSMSRARTFYRVLEALGKKNKEEKSPVTFFYDNRKTLKEITDAIPSFFTREQFLLFMSDWPGLAPVEWQWIEPTKDGIMVLRAGEEGLLQKNERIEVKDPLWMVDVELPLPESSVMNSFFFDAALKRIVSVTPSVRFEGGRLIFSIFPSASMTRELLELTFRMKSIAVKRAQQGYSGN